MGVVQKSTKYKYFNSLIDYVLVYIYIYIYIYISSVYSPFPIMLDFLFITFLLEEWIMEEACSSRSLQDNKTNSPSQVVY